MPVLPDWILNEVKAGKAGLRNGRASGTAGDLAAARLHTVCDEARCPNKGKCFSSGEATFLILGDRCTRSCRFCAVSKLPPLPPDSGEPGRVGEISKRWGLKYAVFTSPTRDDLPDGGAAHFAATVRALKNSAPFIRTEPLVPDFRGDHDALKLLLDAGPHVLGHNLETAPGLYDRVRSGSDYRRSLELIKASKKMRPDILTKSGLMLGLGETEKETEAVLRDLVEHGCDLLTLGQYLAPSRDHLPVARYIPPAEFSDWETRALELGFKAALCGPLVRSSYRADALYRRAAKAMEEARFPKPLAR